MSLRRLIPVSKRAARKKFNDAVERGIPNDLYDLFQLRSTPLNVASPKDEETDKKTVHRLLGKAVFTNELDFEIWKNMLFRAIPETQSPVEAAILLRIMMRTPFTDRFVQEGFICNDMICGILKSSYARSKTCRTSSKTPVPMTAATNTLHALYYFRHVLHRSDIDPLIIHVTHSVDASSASLSDLMGFLTACSFEGVFQTAGIKESLMPVLGEVVKRIECSKDWSTQKAPHLKKNVMSVPWLEFILATSRLGLFNSAIAQLVANQIDNVESTFGSLSLAKLNSILIAFSRALDSKSADSINFVCRIGNLLTDIKSGWTSSSIAATVSAFSRMLIMHTEFFDFLRADLIQLLDTQGVVTCMHAFERLGAWNSDDFQVLRKMAKVEEMIDDRLFMKFMACCRDVSMVERQQERLLACLTSESSFKLLCSYSGIYKELPFEIKKLLVHLIKGERWSTDRAAFVASAVVELVHEIPESMDLWQGVVSASWETSKVVHLMTYLKAAIRLGQEESGVARLLSQRIDEVTELEELRGILAQSNSDEARELLGKLIRKMNKSQGFASPFVLDNED